MRSHVSHMVVSQHDTLYALTRKREHLGQRIFSGAFAGSSVLRQLVHEFCYINTRAAYLAKSSSDASRAGAAILDVAMGESDWKGMRLLDCARVEDLRHDV